MIKCINLFLIALLCSFSIQAQYKGVADDSDIRLAEKLKKENEDASVISLLSRETITFKYDEAKKTAIAENVIREEFLGLSPAKFYKTEPYNDQSSITEASIFYKNGKEVAQSIIEPKYENFKQSGIFHSDAKICYIGMPFYKGYRYDVKMTRTFEDLKYLTSFYFQSSYPMRRRVIEFVIPKWMDVELKEINFDGYDIDSEVSFDPGRNANVHTYTILDLKENVNEPSTPGPSHLYPHILVLSKGYERDGKQHKLFSSVDDLYSWYKQLVDKIENQPDAVKEKVSAITKEAKTDLEKIEYIYYWIQDNIRYVAFEDGIAGFKPDNCQNVFNNKYGDCKGMANLTKQMLTIAGYDARLVWLGTRRLAYDYSVASLAVDNHMICAVILDGKTYYLDPTEKYGALDEYAERIQGRPVLIEDGDKYLIKNIPKNSPDGNASLLRLNLSLNGDLLEGDAQHIYKGESKSYLLYTLNSLESDIKKDALTYYLNEGDNNYSIDTVIVPDLNNRTGNIEMKYNVSIKNKASSFDNEVYLELDFFKDLSSMSMEDDRKNSYQFSYKTLFDTEIELALPEGYTATYIPDALSLENDIVSFQASYKEVDGKLVYSKKLSIKNTLIPANQFEEWNKAIEQLKTFYSEQVTITKE